ncbi:hypothetical protein [Massilia sp. GCM10023247]|uniref:hypothetical protein n=1 Tax=Massilia sp. GCM10023247 TaxID=3252643 RepID=UPI00360A38B0
MPNRLRLTKNAQFYVAKEGVDLDLGISSILAGAMSNIVDGGEVILETTRQARTTPNGVKYLLSARVFESARPVYFIEEEVKDSIYAYIAVLEFDKYVAAFRKSCANISDELDACLDLIHGSRLTSTFDDDAVEYQKIALRNMTVSDRAMRARSFEAADLKGLFSTHAAGRSIPYFFKIRQGGILKTFSTNSGRLVEASERKSVDDIAEWCNEQILSLQNSGGEKSFLNSFARMAILDEVLQATQPTAVLIEAGVVTDRINNGEIALWRARKDKTLAPVSDRLLHEIFSRLEKVYEIDANLNIVGSEKGARLRHNSKSLTLHVPSLRKFRIDELGRTDSLLKYLTKNGLYSICFADPKFMYFMGNCFEDTSGVSEIDSILEILHPYPVLSAVTSEKGMVTAQSTSFSNDCVFSAVETIHANDDYIFCDDLGTEWADHITLNSSEGTITFIHSKYGDESVSASKMHEVVGQGVKNLGHMFFTKAQLLKKLHDKFAYTYNLDGVQTNISRVRQGDPKNIDLYLTDLQRDFRLRRKCVLACSFLSKNAIANEFTKIKAGQQVTGAVVQLLWIISSFAHAARDANVVPAIYCRD